MVSRGLSVSRAGSADSGQTAGHQKLCAYSPERSLRGMETRNGSKRMLLCEKMIA